MGADKPLMRVVFDTNTVISALLFRGSMAWLVAHWQSNTIIPLASQQTAHEFLRVLAYPKFKLTEQQIHDFAARYLPYVERIEGILDSPSDVQCRDAKDQIFIMLAIAGKADIVVTGDEDLLVLRGQVPFSIVTPAEYKNININNQYRYL